MQRGYNKQSGEADNIPSTSNQRGHQKLVEQSEALCRVGRITRIPSVNLAVRVFTAGKRGKVVR
jgi:hypothetical protein